MNKIRKGDQVIVTTGKHKGRISKVLSVVGDKVVVEGVNVVKTHVKPNPMKKQEGGIVIKAMPISVSNVAILNPETKKADRVGIKIVNKEGKNYRIRYYKSNGQEIEA